MELPIVALCAGLAYAGLSWALADVFPFSRYSMYAKLRDRHEGAVLVVLADGREVEATDVVAWHGVDPAAIEPFTVPCSLHWVVFEAQRWIGTRTAASPDGLEVSLVVGYRILRVAPDGALVERFEERARGRGRLRA